MLYVLHGQDDFSLGQWLTELKRNLGDQAMLATNTTTLDGQQMTIDELRNVCESAPFLAEKRLVIVRGLLERFDPRRRTSRRRKTSRATEQQDGYHALSDYMMKIPESTVLVLVDGDIKTNNNPLYRVLSSRAKVKSFPLLKTTELRKWVEKRVAEEGGSISTQAVTLLLRLVGSNLWVMAGEIDKLLLFAAGRRIEEEDVQAAVSYTQQDSVFTMVDAIIGFRARLAEKLLQQLLQRGASPAYLLVMLSRQIRLVVRAKELTNQRESETEIRNKLGLTSEYAVRKTVEQANQYSLPRLKRVYHRLLEADLSIKTGKYDGELALDILIAELCQRGKI